jgi:hypothetical protein
VEIPKGKVPDARRKYGEQAVFLHVYDLVREEWRLGFKVLE